jgi:hypothetical protein
MSVALAATWDPRGELERFRRRLPQLRDVYQAIGVALPPGAVQACEALRGLGVVAEVTPDWSWGRYLALQKAADVPDAAHIHYADLDRLLRWVETRPQEWLQVVARLQECDCLVIGRTPAAYATHPQALVKTEAISNAVVSHFLGRKMDVSAGSKGFSRPAVEFLLANTHPGRALGTDAEWPLVLQRAGFQVEYLEVDGLDWEIADQFQDQAAGTERQRQVAAEYDADPRHWAHRVAVALEIIEVALQNGARP